MNFWVKGNGTTLSTELRIFAECANDGVADPFFSISATPTNSIYPPPGSQAHFYFRDTAEATDPNGASCIRMSDGSYELPAPGNYWLQFSNYTANSVLDGNWHMLTMTTDSNAVIQVYVDGVRDPGSGAFTDPYGESVVCPPLWTTNYYYTTNVYPLVNPPASNPPPNGFVRWMMNDINNSGITTFGGYIRDNSHGAGLVCWMSDIGFWNRVLSPDEITFLMTNGISDTISIPMVFSALSYLPADPDNGGNPSFTATWNSISNQTYTVQRTFSLSDPVWTTLIGILPSGGNTTSFTDDNLESNETAYYRITAR